MVRRLFRVRGVWYEAAFKTVTPKHNIGIAVADPDFERRWGPGFGLLALPAFLPSVISSFLTQNKGGGVGPGPLSPSPRSATES